MSEQKADTMTKVVGYFNPQKYSIFIEISEINLKAELAPNAYVRDRNGNYINDPIFESYVHPKGLGRTTADGQVPINYAPRFMKAERLPASVTQATGFVRKPDGRTAPTFAPAPAQQRQVEVNKTPITGMTVEAARKLGLIGRPKLVDENYGADETSGVPSGKGLPPIKYSTESPPKVRTAAPLRPELTEADEDLTPAEKQNRAVLQQSMNKAAATPTGDQFDPTRVRALPAKTPIPLKASDKPTAIVPGKPATPISPVKSKAKAQANAPAAQKILPKKRVAAVIEPAAEPVQESTPEPEQETQAEEIVEAEVVEAGSGVVQPLDDTQLPPPVLDSPPPDSKTGKRFVCAADGKPFKFRSELERHVDRNFPEMKDQLMAPYPP